MAGATVAGTPLMTDAVLDLLERYVRYKDESMKMAAHTAVTLPSIVCGPALPKSVWLDDPPKEDPMAAPLPDWSNTAMTITTLTMI